MGPILPATSLTRRLAGTDIQGRQAGIGRWPSAGIRMGPRSPVKRRRLPAPPDRLEVTRKCGLSCRHCRAAANKGHIPATLTEKWQVINEIAG
jgi:hypothetical protein